MARPVCRLPASLVFCWPMGHFADRLLDKVEECGSPVCVGIDPVYEKLPQAVVRPAVAVHGDTRDARLFAVQDFSMRVIEAVAGIVPCVKLQSACWERFGWRGVAMYRGAIEAARAAGLCVIADVKRGDIGVTAEHYAHAELVDVDEPCGSAADAVTINSYFGEDGVLPFLEAARVRQRGVFALVRTSNRGGDAIQSLRLSDGRTVAQAVAGLINEFGGDSRYIGDRGYSLLGAVVGATKPQEAAQLRSLMPRQLFLVPGFGAQGGSAEDIRACFRADGTGALITSSRSIIYAFPDTGQDNWIDAVIRAARNFTEEIRQVLARKQAT